jgi:three-Cys-motif partner protein
MDPHTAGKHFVLAEYLKAWFAIIGQTTERMVFIDGFAGPGRYTGGEPGSPIIALNVLRDHASLPRFRAEAGFFFIEERSDRVAALRAELTALTASLPDGVSYEVVEGMFDATLGDVLDRLDADGRFLAPAFVMVDPFGVSGIPLGLMRRLLGNPKCELYITLMASWINRFRNTQEYEGALMELYGDDSWRAVVDLPEGDARVLGFLDLYEAKLRTSGASFVQRFNLYRDNAFLYSIFFATNHRLGCARMKDAIWRLDPSGGYEFRGRRAGRDQLALDIGGQPNLRELGRSLTQHLQHIGVASVSELEVWLDGDETPFRRAHLRDALRPLEDAGTIGVEAVNRRGRSYPTRAIIRLLSSD